MPTIRKILHILHFQRAFYVGNVVIVVSADIVRQWLKHTLMLLLMQLRKANFCHIYNDFGGSGGEENGGGDGGGKSTVLAKLTPRDKPLG